MFTLYGYAHFSASYRMRSENVLKILICNLKKNVNKVTLNWIILAQNINDAP